MNGGLLPLAPPLAADARSGWIRLRTLILLRWLAVLGQSLTVVLADAVLGIRVPHAACALVIGAAAAVNFVAMTLAAENRRLSEREAVLMLLFDVGQLGALLYLTGGLGNPFSLLLMGPVMISAAALTRRATIILAAAAALVATFLARYHVALMMKDGVNLEGPPVLAAGNWTALLIGTAFLALFVRRVTDETFSMSRALAATQMALAREQQLSALGGVVAAAAHELGTPLATIKLASSELVAELAGQPELQEDARLVRDQADRCSEILRAMRPRPSDDTFVLFAPFASVVAEAAGPHAERGKRVEIRVGGAPVDEAVPQPLVSRSPEIVQGLRNLVQNAVDFADTTVWIDLEWTAAEVSAVIGDDGPGYPPELIGRIGDPFVRGRSPAPEARRGYESMGLGLFIAKTLLERSGARLTFENAGEVPAASPSDAPGPTGAVVTVVWPLGRVAPESDAGPGQGPPG